MSWDLTYALTLPHALLELLDLIEQGGFEAVVVGGSVRDLLLNKKPKDYDLATNATPEQLLTLLQPKMQTSLVGLKFGTLGVLYKGQFFEITTYRLEFDYTNHRHPRVSFVNSLESDLSRRDLTINALAFHPKKGLLDLHGGLQDLKDRKLVFVGVPSMRLEEDALRILRAMRFASTLGFKLDIKSENALFDQANLLDKISKERIWHECSRLLVGFNASDVCMRYHSLLERIFGSLDSKLLAKLSCIPPNLVARLLLIYQNCDQLSMQTCLKNLKAPKQFILTLNKLHPYTKINPQDSKIWVKQQLQVLSLSQFRAWLGWLQASDVLLSRALRVHFKIIGMQKEVYSLHFLALKGDHVKNLGLRGAEIGACLQACLKAVVQERVKNELGALLEWAQKWIKDLREYALK
ncbi:CCA tRNA nucleotidyltransferase [Helicobacter suis]|uniref:CCA tRNA nucleotidyltransferase n=1 Tax=Helicobacter suis TaxID=104628 RepID=UPI0013D7AA57|nr:CCA tRNA nucleotidyltransferase [Helicobacter suis]